MPSIFEWNDFEAASRAMRDPAGLLAAHSRVLEPAARRLLIVWHSRTGMAQQMAEAMCAGASSTIREMDASSADLAIDMYRAQDAQIFDLISANGFLFCAPENLATVSGEMKEFFDRCYYGCLGHLHSRPYGLGISAGTDGAGAAAQVTRICRGWRLKPVQEPLVLRNGAQSPAAVAQAKTLDVGGKLECMNLGSLVAAHLLLQEASA